MFFYISQNLYCFKNRGAIIPMTSFLCRTCWSMNYKEQRFDSVFYLCLVIQKSRCVSELNDWGVCVFVRMCVCICQSVHERLTWRVVLPIELAQCCRSGKAESHLLKKRKSLPVVVERAVGAWKHCHSPLAWYGASPLSSCIEPLFHLKEPFANIFSPLILCM